MDMIAHAQRRRDRANPIVTGAVRLHIDHLVLRGVAQADARPLTRALEAELAYLAAQPGARFEPVSVNQLPTAPVVTDRLPEQTGRSVAATVWSSIGKKGRQQ